jgi:hypothetical protein
MAKRVVKTTLQQQIAEAREEARVARAAWRQAVARERAARQQLQRQEMDAVRSALAVVAPTDAQRFAGDPTALRSALRLHTRLQRIPMKEILARVPGEQVQDKVKAIGVARQSYYRWLEGVWRPGEEQARRIAKLTGYTVEQITGKGNYHDQPRPDRPPRRQPSRTPERAAGQPR